MQQTETQHITRSRISIPRRRADLLTRQRLLDAMDELLDKKIILINAPAGYGKTSLLIDLADDLALPICWYALDTLDQNLPRFLEYLVAAIQVRFPEFNTGLINVLRSSTQKEISIDTAVSILSNDIYDQITEHFIIMLDDYHLIKDDPQVNQFLSRFVQQTEENCHIIFASRSLLALPDLPLLVARGLVGGLDQFDLAFNSHETRDLFFFQHHIVLSDDEAEVLQKQTEGWVTGLLLTARTAITRLIPKQKELRATGVNINDYFDLIYNAQSETIRQFLLYTSLLEDFTPSLFANTIGKQFPHLQEQYQDCVDHILTSNLFVQSIQMDELSLRYHHLFLDYLQNKCKLEENERYLELQVLIAEHYEKIQQWEQAYQIYEQEGMLDRQVELIEVRGFDILLRGKINWLLHCVNKLSDSIIENSLIICSHLGSIYSNLGEFDKALHFYNSVLDNVNRISQSEIYGRTSVRKAVILRVFGKHDEALNILHSIISNEYLINSPEIIAEAKRLLGTCYIDMGKPILCIKWINQALSDFTDLQKKDEIAMTNFCLGFAYFLSSRYSEAEKILRDCINYWEKYENIAWLISAYNNYGVILHSQFKYEEALFNLQKSTKYSEITNNKRTFCLALNSITDIFIDLGLYSYATEILKKCENISKEDGLIKNYIYTINSLALIHIHENNNAQNYIDLAYQLARTNDLLFEENLITFSEALYFFHNMNHKKALSLFTSAQAYFIDNCCSHYSTKTNFYIVLCKWELNPLNTDFIEVDQLNGQLQLVDNQYALLAYGLQEIGILKKHIKKSQNYNSINNWFELIKSKQNQFKQISKNVQKNNSILTERKQHLQITTLGSMKVKYNNKSLSTSDWQTQSARDFFFLVLSNPAGFTKEEIGLLLWPDDTLQEFRYHFRNAIYRVRHAIGRESILLEGNIYRFNSDQDFILDVQEFEQEIQASLDAETAQDKQKHYRRANKLYKGPYLPGLDLEIVRLERERLQALYRQMTLEMCQFAFNQEDFQQTIELANQVLLQDPCNEEIYRLAMKAQSAMGNRAEIARLYQRCEDALIDEYDAQPSEQTRKLYKILMRI